MTGPFWEILLLAHMWQVWQCPLLYLLQNVIIAGVWEKCSNYLIHKHCICTYLNAVHILHILSGFSSYSLVVCLIQGTIGIIDKHSHFVTQHTRYQLFSADLIYQFGSVNYFWQELQVTMKISARKINTALHFHLHVYTNESYTYYLAELNYNTPDYTCTCRETNDKC